jgi:hypothetical protein
MRPAGGSSLARRWFGPMRCVWRARPFQDMLLVVIELARSEAPQPRHQVANVAKRSLAPASRSGLFSVGRVFFTGMPVRRRCVAGSLPRRGVGCCARRHTSSSSERRKKEAQAAKPLGVRRSANLGFGLSSGAVGGWGSRPVRLNSATQQHTPLQRQLRLCIAQTICSYHSRFGRKVQFSKVS